MNLPVHEMPKILLELHPSRSMPRAKLFLVQLPLLPLAIYVPPLPCEDAQLQLLVPI